MKCFIAQKRVKGSVWYGATFYNDRGVVLFSSLEKKPVQQNKYDHFLVGMIEALKRVNPLIEQGVLPNEGLKIFINSEILYNWCTEESIPEPYFSKHQELISRLSSLSVETEIFLSSVTVKVLYKDINNRAKTTESALDFLNSVD